MSKGTAHPQWKRLERALARAFGAERNRLSGSSGRADQSRSDSTHPRLFLECKHTKKESAVGTLYKKTAKLAKIEEKIPVIGLRADGEPILVVCALNDLLRIAEEMKEAQANP